MYLDLTLPYKVADMSLAEWGRKEIEISEHEMPGLMAVRRKYGAAEAAEGRARDGIAAHDHPDRRADRDARGAGRRRALVLVQHLLDAGPRRGRHRRTRAFRSSRGRARRCPSTGGARPWRCRSRAARARSSIVDDGGDATLLIHKGYKAENDASTLDYEPFVLRGGGDSRHAEDGFWPRSPENGTARWPSGRA